MLLEALWNLRTARGPKPVARAAVLLVTIGAIGLLATAAAREVLK